MQIESFIHSQSSSCKRYCHGFELFLFSVVVLGGGGETQILSPYVFIKHKIVQPTIHLYIRVDLDL